jgi:hypothetical protein
MATKHEAMEREIFPLLLTASLVSSLFMLDSNVVADRHVVRRTPSEELGFVLAQPVAPGAEGAVVLAHPPSRVVADVGPG